MSAPDFETRFHANSVLFRVHDEIMARYTELESTITTDGYGKPDTFIAIGKLRGLLAAAAEVRAAVEAHTRGAA